MSWWCLLCGRTTIDLVLRQQEWLVGIVALWWVDHILTIHNRCAHNTLVFGESRCANRKRNEQYDLKGLEHCARVQ